MTQAPEYRLVPVEPTEAMLSAIDMTHACEPIDQWRAAIAASPLPAAPAADRAELAAEAQRKLSRACGVWSNLMAYEGFTDAKADAAKAAENEARAAIDALARSTDAPSEPSASAFEARVTDLQSKASMPFAQAAELAASELGPVLCWVHEWGAIGLPLGHASRVTCFAAFNTLPEAIAASEACEFNDRLIPIFEPGAKHEPAGEVVIGPKGDVEGWTVVKWGENGCPPVGTKVYTGTLPTPPAAATSTPCASGEGEAAIDPAALDRAMFERAHKAAGYGEVKWNSAGDRPLFQNDAARYAGWQLARDDLAATQAPAVPATSRRQQRLDASMAKFDTLGPLPGMIAAFETHYGQKWTDADWRNEASVWAAAWALGSRTPTAGNTEDARSMGAVSDAASVVEAGVQKILVAIERIDQKRDSGWSYRNITTNRECIREQCAAIRAAITQAASTGGKS